MAELAGEAPTDATDFFAPGQYTDANANGRWGMAIYLDLVMVLNFLVDFFLLLGTNRLAGFPAGAWRCAGAAVLGSVYSGACLLPGFRFLGNFLWRGVSLCLMGLMAFGCNASAIKRGGIFLLLSMAMGGIALSIEPSTIQACRRIGTNCAVSIKRQKRCWRSTKHSFYFRSIQSDAI